jgi:hypothetical protein
MPKFAGLLANGVYEKGMVPASGYPASAKRALTLRDDPYPCGIPGGKIV